MDTKTASTKRSASGFDLSPLTTGYKGWSATRPVTELERSACFAPYRMTITTAPFNVMAQDIEEEFAAQRSCA
jgi:hypothetical protein